MENEKCPICGNKFIKTTTGSALNFKCSNCDYGIATTNAEGSGWDDTTYTIILEKDEKITKEKIKCLSKVSGLNYFDSKAVLEKGGEIVKGFADEIKSKIDNLCKESINFRIVPKFPY